MWKHTVLSSAAPQPAGRAATQVGGSAPQSPAAALRVITRRWKVIVVNEPAVSASATGTDAVARRSCAGAPGLLRAVHAERLQLGAAPSGPPFGANACVGSTVQPLGTAPVSGLLKVGLSMPSSRL